MLMSQYYESTALGTMGPRGTNGNDSGCPYFDAYETSDGLYMAVGAYEPAFYNRFVDGLGLDLTTLPPQHDTSGWAELRRIFTATFAMKTRAEWTHQFDGIDACVVPVLTLAEAPADAHLRSRSTYIEIDGIPQAAPAPRFSRTPGAATRPPVQDSDALLTEAAFTPERIAELRASGAVD
jgi:alpha-methylacyl-CoA racemase